MKMNILDDLIGYKHITSDSREVTEGSIFVAIKGEKFDGNKFINEAIANGASVIISDVDIVAGNAIFIKVENARVALSYLASKIYNKYPKNIVAVTGTNGKTSIVNIVRDILASLGKKAASIGTLGVIGPNINIDFGMTTPDSLTLAKYLTLLANEGINDLAIEASSHGLYLNRLDNISIKAAAFTNFTQDHLDFHGSFEAYFNAKMLLFNKIMINGTAVLNTDIDEFARILEICEENHHQILTYGKSSQADLRLVSSIVSGGEQNISFSYQGELYKITIPLIGEYQAYNSMAAIGLVISLGYSIESIIAAIAGISVIPGRMELVSKKDDKYIFVDYSHTPDSLKHALLTMKDLKRGKILVVVGCGGDRDKEKRPIMGRIASELADIAVITDDNPRTEDPAIIRAEMIAGCGSNSIEIEGREMAIQKAIQLMATGDTLLIAGKGHENYQIIGHTKFHFDDCEIARKYN